MVFALLRAASLARQRMRMAQTGHVPDERAHNSVVCGRFVSEGQPDAFVSCVRFDYPSDMQQEKGARVHESECAETQ